MESVLASVDVFMVSTNPAVYTVADWLRPVYNFQNVLISVTSLFSAC